MEINGNGMIEKGNLSCQLLRFVISFSAKFLRGLALFWDILGLTEALFYVILAFKNLKQLQNHKKCALITNS